MLFLFCFVFCINESWKNYEADYEGAGHEDVEEGEEEKEERREHWRLEDGGRRGHTWKHPTSMKPKAARTPIHSVKTLRHRIPW